MVFYAILRFLQATRGAGVLRGLVFVLVMALLVVVFLVNSCSCTGSSTSWGRNVLTLLLILAVLFQPEIRRLLLRLGEAPMFRWLFHGEASIVPEIVSAVFMLAQRKIGALIVIEREWARRDHRRRHARQCRRHERPARDDLLARLSAS